MAKLYFRYGAMGSSKTANLLMVRYNYIERGQKVVLLKPRLENRDGDKSIKSRIGIEGECEYAEEFLKDLEDKSSEEIKSMGLSAILVDEAQFLSTEDIDKLAKIVDNYNIPVMCYGLRTDFTGKLFEGSKRLMELADVIEEIPTICWCGRRAEFNARYNKEGIIRKGKQVVLGANDRYVALCRKHFFEGRLSGKA